MRALSEKKRPTWYVDTTLIYPNPLNDDSYLFDLMDEFADYAASASGKLGDPEVGLSLALEASSALEATKNFHEIISENPLTKDSEVEELEVRNEEKKELENSSQQIPDLVSYAEVGEICEFSRQRAREVAKTMSSFPRPLVKTSQGPLFSRHAVVAWRTRRDLQKAERSLSRASA